MDAALKNAVSPHRVFSKESWARLRDESPLNLSLKELRSLRALGDPVSLEEVEQIYLPISRLLAMQVEAAQDLFQKRKEFLNVADVTKTPFIIGIAGSVAVGKSTTARVLRTLLSRWRSMPKVDLITTDGFLFPNAVLEAENLMRKKGFPESYDQRALLTFLSDIKAGKRNVQAPVYSHLVYDVIPDETVTVDSPDILIFEGINVLQTRALPKDGNAIPFVSDFFDYSIYIDAEEAMIEKWYMERFMQLRQTAFQDPVSYFRKVAELSEEDASIMASDLWRSINKVNLVENILPTRPRADLILRKGESHMIDKVFLRRL